MKACARCGIEKPVEEFYLNSQNGKRHSYCHACFAEYRAEYRRENRQKAYRAKKKWEAENPEKVREAKRRRWAENRAAYRAAAKRWREENPEKYEAQKARVREKARTLGRNAYYRHGITLEDRARLEAEQEQACAICRQPFSEQKPFIDHCHQTKLVRGLLCQTCNPRLGWYENNAEAIARYLTDGPAKRLGIVSESKSRNTQMEHWSRS